MKLKEQLHIERPDILFSMASPSAEDELLYCGSSDGSVYGFDLAADEATSREPVQLSGHRSYVSGVARLQNGQLVSSSWDRQLIWWDLTKHQLRRRVNAHHKWIRAVVGSPDGHSLASVADDMVCRVWDARSGKLQHELRGHAAKTPQGYPSMLFTCAYSPCGEFLATADKVGHVAVWDVRTGNAVASLESPEHYTWDPVQRRHSTGGIRSLCFSPDGTELAVGGVGHIENIDGLRGPALVQLFDWRNGERLHRYEHDELTGIVEFLEYLPERNWLVAAGGAKKGILLVIDVAAKQFLYGAAVPMHIHQFKLSTAPLNLLAVGHGRVVRWEIDPSDDGEGDTS